MALEVRGWAGHSPSVIAPPRINFSEIRDDWYRGADLMARLVDQSRRGGPDLTGFPVQWLPLFVHFQAKWSEPAPPERFIPIMSNLTVEQLIDLIRAAQAKGQARVLVEATAALDPLIADVLHKLDRRPARPASASAVKISLTGWQSYGRPEVLNFEDRVQKSVTVNSETAVLLPCSRKRPYRLSRTHAQLWRGLGQLGKTPEEVDQIVISSLGVVPASFWDDPIVAVYDSGVPDIYRVLRLMRAYFGRAKYAQVIDCLEFEPYRDCLRIIERERLVGAIVEGPKRNIRRLPLP